MNFDCSIHFSQKVETLLSKARILFEQGDTAGSIAKVKKAYAIDPNPKTLRKLERLEAVLENERKMAAEVIRK